MKASILSLSALFTILYIVPLGFRPMVTPDEGRYAEIPREMRASENWIVPHLNGLRYFEKPAGGYWLTASSFALFGENRFAMRLPSALAAGISALVVFWLSRRHIGGNLIPFLAAAFLLTCFQFFAIGVFNVLDGPFSMFITVAVAMFFEAAHTADRKRRMIFLAAFGASCGMAFLVKGLLGFVLPGITILPFLLWERRWKNILAMPWIPLAAFLAVTLPWGIAIHLKEPDFWHYFFWVEHVQRFLSPAPSAQHLEPFWYFAPIILAGAMPWSALVPAAILSYPAGRNRSLIRFAVCWLVFPFLFLSGSSGKLGTYILPCFPPFMILTAVGLVEYLKQNRKIAFVVGMRFVSILAAILAIGMVVAQIADIETMKYYDAGETWKWILGAMALVCWSALSWLSTVGGKSVKQLIICCLAPVCLLVSVHFIIPNRSMDGRPPSELLPPGSPQPSKNSVLNPAKYKEGKSPESFLRKHAQRISPDTLIISDCHIASAVCWVYRRSDISITGSKGELSYGLKYADAEHRYLSPEQIRSRITNPDRITPIVIAMNNKNYLHYKSVLPPADFEDVYGGFVFAQYTPP